jgi:hypothetical protein
MLSRVARVGKREDSRAVVLVNRRGSGATLLLRWCLEVAALLNEIGNFPN